MTQAQILMLVFFKSLTGYVSQMETSSEEEFTDALRDFTTRKEDYLSAGDMSIGDIFVLKDGSKIVQQGDFYGVREDQ